jgi:hypothetical protein
VADLPGYVPVNIGQVFTVREFLDSVDVETEPGPQKAVPRSRKN